MEESTQTISTTTSPIKIYMASTFAVFIELLIGSETLHNNFLGKYLRIKTKSLSAKLFHPFFV